MVMLLCRHVECTVAVLVSNMQRAVRSLELWVSVDVGCLCQTTRFEVLIPCAGVCFISEFTSHPISEILQGVYQFVMRMELMLPGASMYISVRVA